MHAEGLLDEHDGVSKYLHFKKSIKPFLFLLLYVSSLWLFLSLKNDVNVLSKSNKEKKTYFLLASWMSLTKSAGSGVGSGSVG